LVCLLQSFSPATLPNSPRSQITLFTQENAKVRVSIEYLRVDEQLNTATAGGWQKEFISERYGTKASHQAGILDICFVVDEALIVSIIIFFMVRFHSKVLKKLAFASPTLNFKATAAPYSVENQEIQRDHHRHWCQKESALIPPQLLPQNASMRWCQLKAFFSRLHFFASLVFLQVLPNL